jgi:two-component system chemotaxis sensor kinase CheA
LELVAKLKKIEESLNIFTVLVGGFCLKEIPDLDLILSVLDEIIENSNQEDDTLHKVSIACKNYLLHMDKEDTYNPKPIEESLVLLKSILNHLKRGEPFAFDYSDVMAILETNFSGDEATEPTEQIEEVNEEEEDTENEAAATPAEPEEISEDDMEIMADFVAEAEENLDTIEISLLELEQDPTNNEIINNIFRPFHTIKGVSGFLSLTKINKLSHTTENLLDSARSGDFIIDNVATDVILESVDTLKKLLERLKEGMAEGFKKSEDDIDTTSLKKKLEDLQKSLSAGDIEPLGEILVKKGALKQEKLDEALETQKKSPGKKIGEILLEEKVTRPAQIASALMTQKKPLKKTSVQVKVSTEKLDDLVDYAGELVIAQSMLRQQATKDSAMHQGIGQLGQIVTDMQNIAMSMRMIPIKATFMKMIRLVRDLSRKSGKEISLNMVGDETEIDRNVVDALYEPMVHMIRNSCDHGVESQADRLAMGKPAQGSIFLRAYHKGGHIIIEIEDDGKGLDKDKLMEKAISKGLVTGTEQMTDSQIYDLIMLPGFSTAKEITDVSGRGVGMDVVKNGIEKFRGQLTIESTKGEGTKFTISLPLTLAIIDGMLVRVDEERYVIPTTAIQKAFKPGKEEYFTVEGKGEMVMDRGSLIPLIRLNEIYNSSTEKKDIENCVVVVVESKEEKRGLLIDELLGKDEYVIKSLGSSLEGTEGLSGGAILADGQVGLILDIYGIFSIVSME